MSTPVFQGAGSRCSDAKGERRPLPTARSCSPSTSGGRDDRVDGGGGVEPEAPPHVGAPAFINDERLPLDNPDAIERTGRDQGEGLLGRTDRLPGDGWVAFGAATPR
ncbi:hypothetical protein ACH4KO_37915 [Streptomyces anulatus]